MSSLGHEVYIYSITFVYQGGDLIKKQYQISLTDCSDFWVSKKSFCRLYHLPSESVTMQQHFGQNHKEAAHQSVGIFVD